MHKMDKSFLKVYLGTLFVVFSILGYCIYYDLHNKKPTCEDRGGVVFRGKCFKKELFIENYSW